MCTTENLPNDLKEPEINSPLDTMRHSCAHVMAHAVKNLWPNAKFGIGPTIENGFYYDIDLPIKLTPEDLPKIESEMKKIIKANSRFQKAEHTINDALLLFKNLNQTYKIEIIETLQNTLAAKTVSSYQEGDFTDLCRGPHVNTTGEIRAFKLLSIAGAYWRGSEKNPQLQRIYGTVFDTKQELDEHLSLLEEAKKRDHRKLGKELNLFSFHPEAPASPFFHPKGAIIYNTLIEYIRNLYGPFNYEEIITPQILDISLWKKSGHYDNYFENMYFTEVDEREYAIKPMNCPASTFVYSSNKRSYRDLPLRFADFGRLHRYERSGAISGLTRVRSFCQDDAHIFCTPAQIGDEIAQIIEMTLKTHKLFQFESKIFLATRPPKRVGSDALWDQAETVLKSVLDSLHKPYQLNPGDGAFYGPKIDFYVKDALKREIQLTTIQLDFNLPERFELEYIDKDSRTQRPVMIHRAVLGSIERFMSILIEHVGGAFPFWLAPVQARIITIKDIHKPYCRDFFNTLKKYNLRVDLDARNESMGLKTREAQMEKIPFSLVAGDKEIQAKTFAVRRYGQKESNVMQHEEILNLFLDLNNEPKKIWDTKTPV
ncbi:MAG: threonine--tRNA ligase [Bdellovibrio sp.]|nr:threonine--tRNA ligase [Bdellovibrio sp.]